MKTQGSESAQNVTSLDQRRELATQRPAGPPAIEMFMDDDRIIFRDQDALDEYVRDSLREIRNYVDDPGNWSVLDGRRRHLLNLIDDAASLPEGGHR